MVTEHESVDASMEFLEHNYGCAITIRQKLAPEGRWEALREEIRELFASANQATGGDSSRLRSICASSRARRNGGAHDATHTR